MALPAEPTANELAEFLSSNDGSHEQLTFVRSWYDDMETWTDPEVRSVADSAQENTSIRDLAIDVAGLKSSVADDIGGRQPEREVGPVQPPGQTALDALRIDLHRMRHRIAERPVFLGFDRVEHESGEVNHR